MSLQKGKQGPTQPPPPPQQATTTIIQTSVVTTQAPNFHRGVPQAGTRIETQDVYNRPVVYPPQPRPPLHPGTVPQGGIAHDINKQHYTSQAGIATSSIPQQAVHHSAAGGMYQGQVPVRQQTSAPSGVQPVAHQQAYHRQTAPSRQIATMPGQPARQQAVPMTLSVLSTPQNTGTPPNFYPSNVAGVIFQPPSHVQQMPQTLMYQSPHPSSMQTPVEMSPSTEALSVSYMPQHPTQRYPVDNSDMSSSSMPYRFPHYSTQGTPVMFGQHQPAFTQNTLYYHQMILQNTNRVNMAPMSNVQQPQQPNYKRERKIINIVDPSTNRDITEDILATSRSSGNPTPPHSGASSARGTPPSNATPPPPCQEASDIAAQFARQVAAVATVEPVSDPIKDQQQHHHHPLSQPRLPTDSVIVCSSQPITIAAVSPPTALDNISPDVVVCTTVDSVGTSVSDVNHRNQAVAKATDVSVNGAIPNLPEKPEAVVSNDGHVSEVHRVIASKPSGIVNSDVGDVSDDRTSGIIKKSELSKSLEKPPATATPSSTASNRGPCVVSSSLGNVDVAEPPASVVCQLQQPPVVVSLPPHSRTRCGSENVKQGPPQSTPPFPVQKPALPDTSVLPPRTDKKEVSIKFGTIDDILPQSVMGDKQHLLSPTLPIKLPAGPASGATELPITTLRTSGAPPGMPTHPITQSAANKHQPPSSQVIHSKGIVAQHPKQPSPSIPATDPVPFIPPVHPKQNGEMAEPVNENLDTGDGDVSAKDSKNQKCKRKGKDSIRKGEMKESGETDAFLDKPATPQEITSQVNTETPVHQKPLAQEEDKSESNEETKLVEELIDEEEQRKVAEKNEENVKVSKNLAQQETQQKDVPVIKEPEPSFKPTLTLQLLSYKDDQWSPTNPGGKMQYDREFLLQLQQQPMSKKKPEGLPNLEVIVATNKPRERNSGGIYSKTLTGSQVDFTPNYLSNNSRPQARGKSSQLGRKEQQPPKKVVSISLSQDVKLHKSEDAWKPTHKSYNIDDPEKEKTEKLYRRVRALLNKLTPQNFGTLMNQVAKFEINTEERLAGVIDLVFEKAIDEPNFSSAYANMCKNLSSIKVPIGNGEDFVNFRKLIITKCQREFEKNDNEQNEQLLAERTKNITADSDEKQKDFIEEIKERIRKSKLRSLGNIRFIGELFKLSVLTPHIMHDCIQKLIGEKDEESIECLCRLLTTIGKDLDKYGKPGQADSHMDQYFKQLRVLSADKRHLSSRVRFMLQDVIDLREQKWIPRRDENNPKTIDQIHREAEKEQQDKQAMFSQPMSLNKRPDERRGGIMGGGGKRGGSNESEGWNTVGPAKRATPSVDPGKTRITKPDADETNVQLGPRGGLWGKGSSGGVKSSSQEGDRHLNSAPNKYSVLAAEHGTPIDSRRNNSRQGSAVTSNRDSSKSRSSQLPPVSHRGAKVHLNKERTAAVGPVRNIVNNEPRYQTSASRDSSMSREMERKDTDNRRSPPDLDRDAMSSKAKHLIDEFLHQGDYKEAVLGVSELCSPNSMVNFVVLAINLVIERSSQARHNLGQLFSELVKKQIITIDQYHQGMQEFLDIVEEIIIDVPRVWEYTAEIFSPMLENGVMLWSCLKEYVNILKEKKEFAEKFLANVITEASKKMGKPRVSECWRSSGLSLSELFSPNDVQKMLKDYSLQYLEDSRSSVDDRLSMAEIQNGLKMLLQTTSKNEHVFDWINAHVVEKQQREPAFIRALVSELATSAIIKKDGNLYELSVGQFTTYCTVIKRYVDNEDKLELQTLFALQAICYRLQHPPNLLHNLFRTLYDEEVISEDAFDQWKSTEVPQEMEGHAVAVKAVNQFLDVVTSKDQDDDEEAP